MLEGLLAGVVLVLVGAACGAGLVYYLERRHERERVQLYHAMGMLQGRLQLLEQEFSCEEATAKDLGLDS